MQSGPRNRLRLAAANKAAANKAALVKRLKALNLLPRPKNNKLNRKMSNNNRRVVTSNVVDARVKLLQKALQTSTEIVDARQKLTKQKDAREKIQERRLQSTAAHNVSIYI